MLGDLGFIALGILLLWGGAEALVGGAANLALRWRIAPRVVGLTIVAFGTSLPELLVSLQAALANPPMASMAVGNAVGSNIANVCLILGIGALIAPLVVSRQVLLRDLPVALAFGLALWVLTWIGGAGGPVISRLDGALLVGALIAFVVFSLRNARPGDDEDVPPMRPRHLAVDVLLVLVGLGLLVGGSAALVEGASNIARAFQISDRVIGVTVVAFGTSLPELVTTVVAGWHGQSDLGLGNVIGSNIFNVGAIVGFTAVLTPLPVESGLAHIDMPVMLGAMVLLFPYLRSDWRLSRKEGLVLLGGYAGYTVYLFW